MMLLTRFLGYFARVEAPTRPAKIQFLLHDHNGEPFSLCSLRSVVFDVDDATWTVNLMPDLLGGKSPTLAADKPEEKTIDL